MVISGILITDKRVVSDTIVTDNDVSRPNFEENIVDNAAVGALIQVVSANGIVPLIPQI